MQNIDYNNVTLDQPSIARIKCFERLVSSIMLRWSTNIDCFIRKDGKLKLIIRVHDLDNVREKYKMDILINRDNWGYVNKGK